MANENDLREGPVAIDRATGEETWGDSIHEQDTEPPPPAPATDPAPPPSTDAVGVQLISVVTSPDVQRAVSDAFFAAARTLREQSEGVGARRHILRATIARGFDHVYADLVARFELVPMQVFAGVVRWIYDFAKIHAGWNTLQLGQYIERAWVTYEQAPQVSRLELVTQWEEPADSRPLEPAEILAGAICWAWWLGKNDLKWKLHRMGNYLEVALGSFDDMDQTMRSRRAGRQ